MTQQVRQFRLYAKKCRCPFNDRPELSSEGWRVEYCKPPERTISRGSWDEIVFEAPNAVVAQIACTAFPPLFTVVRMHLENGCTYRLEQKVDDGVWEVVYKP